MARKVLVITAGTIAAGVGVEFLKQIKNHKASDLQALVRYLDTAHLPTRYPNDIHDGEWAQMTIDPHFIDAISRNRDRYPELKALLYSDLLPTIQGSGGGSIRYNGAGAIEVNHERIKKWLRAAITQLISTDEGQINLSIAVVVSAVGATGGGSLERLINIIIETAQDANLPEPLHCDVFILQPGAKEVTDLNLANTLALYAEMAATRLLQQNAGMRNNRGRVITVGWGSQSHMASIEQLKEATATLMRVTHDPSTDIAAEFEERAVDNHALLQLDSQTGLPSFLSSATVVTISLGDLEEKIIQRDAARLIDYLVFGGIATETMGGEYMATTTVDRQANILLSVLSNFLGGESPEKRHLSLLRRLGEAINTRSVQLTAAQMAAQSPNVKEQANRLGSIWQADKRELATSGREKVEKKGAELASGAIKEMLQTRRDQMGTGLSLKKLRDDYLELRNLLGTLLKVAQDAEQADPSRANVPDDGVRRSIEALERANRFNRQSLLEQAIGAVQNNVINERQREILPIATQVLKELERHVAESFRNLDLVLQKLNRQRKTNLVWAAADKPLRVEINHPLHLPVLADDEQIRSYANQVSIFEAGSRAKTTTVGRLMTGEEAAIDPLAEFRKWMADANLLDALFKGNVDSLLNVALTFAREYVHKEVEKHSVIEVIFQTDEAILLERLKEAARRAHASVSFSDQFAPDNRQARLVSAYYDKDEERAALLAAINEAFGQGNCQLVKSRDRTEIVVFYYVDGLPLSAINDLSGRCLDAFLKRRQDWYQQQKQSPNGKVQPGYNHYIGVPVYSGQDAEKRVLDTGVIKRLYQVKRLHVKDYPDEDIPELQ
ncbi:MAG TPA: hypothetical protein VKY19_21880 [Ktedonosporobacter sp.]|jgi:hypothetical protein|nr:hypothetical protein [Ktedonosporobacter sp.]